MDYLLDEEKRLYRKGVREFLERELEPHSERIDREGRIPREVVRRLGEYGLLGITLSEEYGGAGVDYLTAALVAEEIGRADISLATAVYYLLQASWGKILEKFGRREVRDEFLPRIVRGEWFIGIASTEPHGGSDVANLRTMVSFTGDRFRVRGEKMFISGVREAGEMGGGFITIMRHEPGGGHRGLTAAVTTLDKEGVETGLIENMGRTGISTGYIRYNDAEYPIQYLLGNPGDGFYIAMEGFNLARPLVAAACIGAAEKALELGIRFLKERVAFGRPLAKFEALQFEAVEDHVRLDMARDLVYKAAWMLDEHYGKGRFSVGEVNKYAAAAKWVAAETAYQVFTHVMMWHGALGYSRELPLERGLRGVMSYLVGAEGAINVMKLIVGRELFGREYMPTKS